MISTKFKPGDKIRHKNCPGDANFLGVVANVSEAMDLVFTAEPVVWAYWNNDKSHCLYAEEKDVELVGPRFKRNLPDWF